MSLGLATGLSTNRFLFPCGRRVNDFKHSASSRERLQPYNELFLKRTVGEVKSESQQIIGNKCGIKFLGSCKRNIRTIAALSSFAESDGEDLNKSLTQGAETRNKANNDSGRKKSEDQPLNMQGMAEALNISPRTAFGIATGIALAAIVLPLCMNSLGHGLSLKTKSLFYLTLLFGFYMAWNIGANDVANAMGTSVGSGALTLRQAVLAAAFLEFSGAFLMGSHVSGTMQKGILVSNVFNGKDSLLFAGMLSSLAASGTWLQVASYYGWPVSTTHCIIGAMVGFGLMYGGVGAVYWRSLAKVVSSWIISPVMGAIVSFTVYKCIRVFVYSAPRPGQAAAAAAPLAVFSGVAVISYLAFPLSSVTAIAIVQALSCGILGAVFISIIINRQLGHLLTSTKAESVSNKRIPIRVSLLSDIAGPRGDQLKIVYSVFGYLQVLSACFMSFAHGANDVANAIGPIGAALSILQGKHLGGDMVIPIDIIAWGGFGIVAGLLVWGYKVIATIGKKITELTPTRGFAAEFAAATVVVVASKLGLPISATHTLVGAVMGVGFARGLNSVRVETVKEIVVSWAVTIPIGAIVSVAYTWILFKFIPTLG
eukprot:TRINITY_DN19667_c0_g1_i1.p1 TRINITY_DN19667_c0_g1~~TRINITY_DN19667_c0_g1_i1.p1  ORF type:complete len:597 (+),score=93.04 TRINITY_DN19667_c0_g1_i1:607-2397(+)